MLVILIVCSLVNIAYLKTFTTGLTSGLDSAMERFRAGDAELAAELVRAASEKWLSSDGYTHIFIRHSEIDAVTDCFHELLGAVSANEEGAAEGAYGSLRARLESLYSMERLTPGSILYRAFGI